MAIGLLRVGAGGGGLDGSGAGAAGTPACIIITTLVHGSSGNAGKEDWSEAHLDRGGSEKIK
jgi:hypothetical protein